MNNLNVWKLSQSHTFPNFQSRLACLAVTIQYMLDNRQRLSFLGEKSVNPNLFMLPMPI